MENMSIENANETKVDQPQDEFSDSQGQVEDTGEEASEPPKFNMDAELKSINKMDDLLETTQRKLSILNDEIERVEWWITKGLSAKGIRAFAFSAMLNELNQHIITYAGEIGYAVRYWVDMEKESKPFVTTLTDLEGNAFDYNEVSGGQQQRVDVCMSFAMHDVFSCKTQFNIMLMDELFEGLDDEYVEVVMTMLQKKARTVAVYMISHNAMLDDVCQTKTFVELGADGDSTIN